MQGGFLYCICPAKYNNKIPANTAKFDAKAKSFVIQTILINPRLKSKTKIRKFEINFSISSTFKKYRGYATIGLCITCVLKYYQPKTPASEHLVAI